MQRLLQINLFGTFFLTQAATRQMVKQGMVEVYSLLLICYWPCCTSVLAAYGMTKAGLDQLVKNLVIDLGPHKININTMVPGATLTERTLIEDPDYLEIWSRITPSGRPSTTDDIVNAALF
jgi:3-oxoacyl-[acyl-carrier protein] reductase